MFLGCTISGAFFFLFFDTFSPNAHNTLCAVSFSLTHTHELTHRSSSWLSRSPAPSLHLFLSLSFSRTHTQSDCFKHQAIVSLSSFQSKKKFILSVGSGQCGHIYYNITETSQFAVWQKEVNSILSIGQCFLCVFNIKKLSQTNRESSPANIFYNFTLTASLFVGFTRFAPTR